MHLAMFLKPRNIPALSMFLNFAKQANGFALKACLAGIIFRVDSFNLNGHHVFRGPH